jgi:hypothetical protein
VKRAARFYDLDQARVSHHNRRPAVAKSGALYGSKTLFRTALFPTVFASRLIAFRAHW